MQPIHAENNYIFGFAAFVVIAPSGDLVGECKGEKNGIEAPHGANCIKQAMSRCNYSCVLQLCPKAPFIYTPAVIAPKLSQAVPGPWSRHKEPVTFYISRYLPS